MSSLNTASSKDELLAKLEAAKKNNDFAETKKIEEEIQKLDEQGRIHQTEMNEANKKANQEKSMKMEELTNMLKDAPENAEKNAETIVNQTKKRLQQTIDRYKNLKTMSEQEKQALQAELKKAKEDYENAKNYLLGTLDYTPENLKRISTRRIRGFKKEVEGGVVSYKLGEVLQISTIKRRMTINKLIKKFNKIGDNPTDGVRFIMGFKKPRFMRYTGAKFYGAIDKLGTNMGMQITPEQFHSQFNRGKNNIFAILDKGNKTSEEQKIIDALKKRINYYGYAYARQRATAWTNPFLQAEKNATEGAKIIQMNSQPANQAKAA